MKVVTFEKFISKDKLPMDGLAGIKSCYENYLIKEIKEPHRVIRFVVTKSDDKGYYCEIDCIVYENEKAYPSDGDFFSFRKRTHENTDKFTSVLLIPTGIGAEIGGHCGDGNAVARLIASASDVMITHPNVVNASDLNEMLDNTQYVEGSTLTRFLLGKIGLAKTRANRILMLMDKHPEKFFNDEVVNAMSSARITLGMDGDVYEMPEKIQSTSQYSQSGRARGEIQCLEHLFTAVEKFKGQYDAIALSTFIDMPEEFHKEYFENDDMVNPWGGIESMITHSLSEIYNIPCAHSPMLPSSDVEEITLGIVDPRKAPESASTTYLHCILKGLHHSPRIVGPNEGMTLEDVSCVIIPDGCIGLPTLACIENDIPLIVVRDNKNIMQNDLNKLPFKSNKIFFVNSYLEAAGVMSALKVGVHPDTTRRPIKGTTVLS